MNKTHKLYVAIHILVGGECQREISLALDQELGEMGVGYYKSLKKEEPAEDHQPEILATA